MVIILINLLKYKYKIIFLVIYLNNLMNNFTIKEISNSQLIIEHNSGVIIKNEDYNSYKKCNIYSINDINNFSLVKHKDKIIDESIIVLSDNLIYIDDGIDKYLKIFEIKKCRQTNTTFIILKFEEIDVRLYIDFVRIFKISEMKFDNFGVIIDEDLLFTLIENSTFSTRSFLKKIFITTNTNFVMDVYFNKDYDRKYKITNEKNNEFFEL